MVSRKHVKMSNTRSANALKLLRSEQPLGGSSSGRTADSDSANLGSNPSPPAKQIHIAYFFATSIYHNHSFARGVIIHGCSSK